ncbi:MAG: TldD/PmbA family protein [Symbiobacteriaceae bacterium]|nr:TldD/PmbA family protein [Symbiobacteriaceae bacterium]
MLDLNQLQEKITQVLAFIKAQDGVEYADLRVNSIETESYSTENMKVQSLNASKNLGYGIRVYAQGSMGFAGSQDFTAMEETAKTALAIAKATQLTQKNPVKLSPKKVVKDHYQTPVEIDPFTISKEEKLALLFEAERLMREAAPELFRTHGTLTFRKERKTWADSDGSYIVQDLVESGGGIDAVAITRGEMQTRSYPNSSRGNFATAGFEFIKAMDLLGNAPRVGRECLELLKAEECPSGIFDLVIAPTQLTLQIHESVGHPIELDRVLGYEAGYAGTSFLDSVEPGKFRYGSEHVNIVADATAPGGLGTYGYDDDGIPAQRVEVITNGIFHNFISSRDTAGAVGSLSNGTARADGWGRIPIVRMSNINLLAGKYAFDELIAGIENGFYLDINRSWSIDDRRLNFQFACEIAYEIKNGKLTGKIYKNPIYTGITPVFWGSCDGVASQEHWRFFGTPNCGKGEPSQSAHCGHGSAPARFRGVKVGVADV